MSKCGRQRKFKFLSVYFLYKSLNFKDDSVVFPILSMKKMDDNSFCNYRTKIL